MPYLPYCCHLQFLKAVLQAVSPPNKADPISAAQCDRISLLMLFSVRLFSQWEMRSSSMPARTRLSSGNFQDVFFFFFLPLLLPPSFRMCPSHYLESFSNRTHLTLTLLPCHLSPFVSSICVCGGEGNEWLQFLALVLTITKFPDNGWAWLPLYCLL